MNFELSSFLSVIVSLFILEILLSVDNALVNASLAESLPSHQRAKAIRAGILFGTVFRVVALFFASLIIHNHLVRNLGAIYLIWLAINHLGKEVTPEGRLLKKHNTYKKTVLEITIANIAFSIDNVVSAVGLSKNLLYVITGVLIGIAAILLLSQLMLKVVERYPSLGTAAYIIVGLIGALILVEGAYNTEISAFYKFLMISGIIGLTLWYEYSLGLRRLVSPSLRKVQLVLGLPGDLYLACSVILKQVVRKIR